jgi:hypothetical protein
LIFPRCRPLCHGRQISFVGDIRFASSRGRSRPSPYQTKLFLIADSASSSQFLSCCQRVHLSDKSWPTVRQSNSQSGFPLTVGIIPRLCTSCMTTNVEVTALGSFRSYSYKLKSDFTNSGTGSQQPSSRRFTLSAKAILEASPLSVQPYLKLIRFDRPIGRFTRVHCCISACPELFYTSKVSLF